jgi:MtN3 and saliva related transmembrane protein
MEIIALLATILGIVTGLANVPQIIKTFKTKSAKDLSIITQTIFLTSSIIWLVYGFELKNFPLVASNILYVVTYTIIIIGFCIYGKKRR